MLMKNLIKKYDMFNDKHLYEYIIESFINGQLQQCIQIFKEFKKDDRIKFLDYLQQKNNDINIRLTYFLFKSFVAPEYHR